VLQVDTPVAGTTEAFELNLGATLVDTAYPGGVTTKTWITAAQRHKSWIGSLRLSLFHTAAGSYSMSNITLTSDEELFVTGLSGPWRAQGRADRCPKCGGLSTRDTWVQDGYTNYRVCPRCYDPPDEVGRHVKPGREREGIGEG
jgi:hypothetical protein